MSKNQGVPAKIAAGISHHLQDSRHGRRSLRWLAERSGVPYSTLQSKMTRAPEKFSTSELCLIADALEVPYEALYLEVAA